MGTFDNTSIYNNSIDSLIQGQQSRINAANPYYKYTDKKPTPVTYWNINSTQTTLDCGTEQPYDQLTQEDPIRYNRVLNFLLYGLGQIETDIRIGEYGPESQIEGECLILPNTVIPFESDYFTIDYLINGDQRILFRVVSVNRDTLDNNANFYRIHYQLNQTQDIDYKYLMEHTVKTYKYISSNAGTNFIALLDEETENGINQLSNLLSMLRQFYMELFYRPNIQTFIYPYMHGSFLIYDPYLIEFLIRSKLYSTSDSSYLYISQATFKSLTFSIEYSKTLFNDIENRDHDLSLNTVWPINICDANSLLIDRMEEYLELSIQRQNFRFHDPINFLNMDLFDRIVNDDPYDESDESLPIYKNVIINFMNNKDASSITAKQIESIKNIEYARTKDLYYELPLIMYTLSRYITDLMTNPVSTGDGVDSTTCLCNPCYVNRM